MLLQGRLGPGDRPTACENTGPASALPALEVDDESLTGIDRHLALDHRVRYS